MAAVVSVSVLLTPKDHNRFVSEVSVLSTGAYSAHTPTAGSGAANHMPAITLPSLRSLSGGAAHATAIASPMSMVAAKVVTPLSMPSKLSVSRTVSVKSPAHTAQRTQRGAQVLTCAYTAQRPFVPALGGAPKSSFVTISRENSDRIMTAAVRMGGNGTPPPPPGPDNPDPETQLPLDGTAATMLLLVAAYAAKRKFC